MSETFDFVAVGSGPGALCAALALRAAGKSVLVLEKAELVGGTTATSGGVMWIPNNRYMKAAGVADSREQALSYMNAVVGDSSDTPGATQQRQETYVDKAPEMLEFLISQGLQFRRIPNWPDYVDAPGQQEGGRTVISELFDLKKLGPWKAKLRKGFIPIPAYIEEAMELPYVFKRKQSTQALWKILGRTFGSMLKGQRLATAGQALAAQLLHAALEAGAQVRVNCGVKELIVEDGRVTGVVADCDGKETRINASGGVLINAGGFAKNQSMLDQYIPGTRAEWSGTIAEDTGDLILAGQRIGAALAQMDQRVGYPAVLTPAKPDYPTFMQGDMAKPHSITVDHEGKRFMCEAASYATLSKGIWEHHRNAPAMQAWMVVDSQYASRYSIAGGRGKKLQAWVEAGFIKKGENLSELAAACNIDGANLEATVARFNGFVANNRDEDFGRGSHVYQNWLGDALAEKSTTLGSLSQGPFYAVPVYPGDVSTYGGLVTDSDARVLRDDGSVIEGLYATGVSTASVMGKGCTGAGASIGPSVTWGYVAAQHVLNNTEAG